MLDTGVRPEEVFHIERANVDLVQRTIANPFGKTKAAKRIANQEHLDGAERTLNRAVVFGISLTDEG
jgi:hypothetical protein